MDKDNKDQGDPRRWAEKNPQLEAILQRKLDEGEREYKAQRRRRDTETREESEERKRARKRSIRTIADRGSRVLNKSLMNNEESIDGLLVRYGGTAAKEDSGNGDAPAQANP